jgi:hypothetical protein
LKETRGWLKFIVIADLLQANRITGVRDEGAQLIKIIGKSVSTAKGKSRGPNAK